MRIGELAERTGTTTKTIRYYESIGLVAEPGRTPAGYREYGESAVERLRFVREAQATGLTLTEIRSVLELKDAGATTCRHTTSLLHRHLRELDDQIERLVRAASRAGRAGRPGGRARPVRVHRPEPVPGDRRRRDGSHLTFQPTGICTLGA